MRLYTSAIYAIGLMDIFGLFLMEHFRINMDVHVYFANVHTFFRTIPEVASNTVLFFKEKLKW
jgi:hypothetical protein